MKYMKYSSWSTSPPETYKPYDILVHRQCNHTYVKITEACGHTYSDNFWSNQAATISKS